MNRFSILFDLPTQSDWIYFTLAFLLISILLLLSNSLPKRFKIPEEYSRKLLHISVGSLAAFAPFIFDSALLLISFATLFLIIDFVAIKKGYFQGIHGHRFSFGTVYFPIAYIFLIIVSWPLNKQFITLGIFLFAVPDALAAVAGQKWAKEKHIFYIADKKSIPGSLVMMAISTIVFFVFFTIYNHTLQSYHLIFISIFSALIVSVVEVLSSKGSDNLFVPLSGAFISYLLLNSNLDHILSFYLAVFIAGIVAWLSYNARFLSIGGSLMTFLLAITVFWIGGIKFIIPILVFFILSSLLSKAGKGRKKKFFDTFEKTGVRDQNQVIANGGIAGLLVIIHYYYPFENIYWLYIISLAVATADTWATEIGIYFNSQPILITTLKKVKPGVSGAISIPGTTGSLLGSLVLVLSSVYFLNQANFFIVVVLTIMGFFGSLVDSFLGATVQAQYKCSVCEKYTEKKIHCDKQSNLIQGNIYITNDMVNILSSVISILFFLSLKNLF